MNIFNKIKIIRKCNNEHLAISLYIISITKIGLFGKSIGAQKSAMEPKKSPKF